MHHCQASCRIALLLGMMETVSTFRAFTPSAFTIQRQVGQLGFATEVEWQYYGGQRNPLDPQQPARTVEASGISVRLFQATLLEGERCLLKEFMPSACEIGENELQMYQQLSEGSQVPVQLGTLLGYMRSDASFDTDSFRDAWSRSLPRTPPPMPGNLWLVFRWQGLSTVGNFPRVPQERDFFDFGGKGLRQARSRYLKVLTGRSLQVLAFLHGRGIVHRSVGPSSLLLSTTDQSAYEQLSVRAIDLGFAASASTLPQDEIDRAIQRGASPLNVLPLLALNDLHGLGYVLIELFLATAAAQDAPDKADSARSTEQQALKRLIEDIFGGDVRGEFRDYCAEEPAWAGAVAMLDEDDGAGWELLQQLVDCRRGELAGSVSAQSLLDSSKWFQ